MSMKREVEKTVDNVKDTFTEAGHRANADAERANREEFGDTMTTGEKAGSVFREGKEDVKAGIDRAKRDIRSNT